ncbi:hypothetical protein CROQUDRAFT_136569 [Cronartium quercuum f. sp. fusiforme G11]|uniref:Uncharacterized protein n=1 Tax=Cronartium quercuum f. sp. fusiforme G11 TaxID=708437 RepID=A0A9P6NAC2_9BASI|nr:hypothetical protein CROQUDRAFT_136569 [Cronartium quercuum f. sp. fusiforme G11]
MLTSGFAVTLILLATANAQSVENSTTTLPLCVAKYKGQQNTSATPPTVVKADVLPNTTVPKLSAIPGPKFKNRKRVVSNVPPPSAFTPVQAIAPPIGGNQMPVTASPSTEAPELPLRFHTTGKVTIIKGGDALCGQYSTDTYVGACLWTGTDPSGSDPKQAGWLNSASQAVCGDQLWVARASNPQEKIPVLVTTGCDFGGNVTVEFGCNNLYLTQLAFTAFKATPQEVTAGYLNDLIWDFILKNAGSF